MTSDLDIYRTASVLIREYGHKADLVAFAFCYPPIPNASFAHVVNKARNTSRLIPPVSSWTFAFALFQV